MNWNILAHEDIEISAKYMYVVLSILTRTGEVVEISNDKIAKLMGVSNQRMYRARGKLVEINAINHIKKFCPETGKRVIDAYEIVSQGKGL